jgi:NAD+ synthase (glutamine-hydrolysing)
VNCGNDVVRETLLDITDTPISPELIPADESGNIKQKTEDLVGPYELHDFFLYNFIRNGFAPDKIYFLAKRAFLGKHDCETIKKWLSTFMRRFFIQQFKRSCMPDGPVTGRCNLSPQGGWTMPADSCGAIWNEACKDI